MSTGWTWREVETELDLPTLAALSTYWRAHPPVHLMVAAYLGLGEKPKAPEMVDNGLSLFDVMPRAAAPFKPGGSRG
jgi:hypothetical protein